MSALPMSPQQVMLDQIELLKDVKRFLDGEPCYDKDAIALKIDAHFYNLNHADKSVLDWANGVICNG